MKQPMYMTGKELIETFGKGPRGKRRVTSDMVRWLLTGPNPLQLMAAAATKEPVELKIDPRVPQGKVYLMREPMVMPSPSVVFDFGLPDEKPVFFESPKFDFGSFSDHSSD